MKRYQVTIRYLNGTERTATGSYAYCARVRRAAFRMCHGWFDVKPIETPEATFEVTRIEVGTGKPGYRWTTGYYVIRPDGAKLHPPMTRRDAIAFCKAQGWDHRAINNPKTERDEHEPN